MGQRGASDQAEVVDFLSRAASYGHAAVERIDTHGAMVFLAGDRAYKLKRAVRLPYLDFSTLDKRREACRRELDINRRTTPRLYLDMLPIRRDAAGLRFGGDGEVVDWVVVMERFGQEALLDRAGRESWRDAALMERLARAIRGFHHAAPRRTDASWLPALDGIVRTIDETLLGDPATPPGLPAAACLAALRQALRAQAPLLRERLAEGYVRRCHGDLHLKNIVLLDGEPVLFDAIEFDEELATIDVLYDLAFLLMDLCHRGARAGANMVLSAYCQGDVPLRELAGLRLLPLFMSLRAAIRAMVGVHALPVTPPDKRAEAEESVAAYAGLAAGLLEARGPALVCVGGLSGTGKTTVARGLAPGIGAAPGAVHLRSDVERKLMFGVEPSTRLPAEAYAEDVSAKVYARLLDKAAAILRAGHATVIDTGFREPERREAAARVAREAGVPFRGLWLEADPALMIARVEQRRGDASDAGREVVLRQRQAASTAPPAGWVVIDANGGPELTLATALAACPPD